MAIINFAAGSVHTAAVTLKNPTDAPLSYYIGLSFVGYKAWDSPAGAFVGPLALAAKAQGSIQITANIPIDAAIIGTPKDYVVQVEIYETTTNTAFAPITAGDTIKVTVMLGVELVGVTWV